MEGFARNTKEKGAAIIDTGRLWMRIEAVCSVREGREGWMETCRLCNVIEIDMIVRF